ncbi:MAG: helix-turn-helix transcriptional regulator [Brevinematales bacterium]|jgi:DNA-binding PadR family transcriptional regulator
MGETSIQLKKGVIEILILKLLSREKMYGYQLLQELDIKTGGIFKMKEGTLYPVLYRLEDNAFISSLWEEGDKNMEKRPVPRKYYKITPDGIIELEKLVKSLRDMIRGINLILEEEI